MLPFSYNVVGASSLQSGARACLTPQSESLHKRMSTHVRQNGAACPAVWVWEAHIMEAGQANLRLACHKRCLDVMASAHVFGVGQASLLANAAAAAFGLGDGRPALFVQTANLAYQRATAELQKTLKLIIELMVDLAGRAWFAARSCGLHVEVRLQDCLAQTQPHARRTAILKCQRRTQTCSVSPGHEWAAYWCPDAARLACGDIDARPGPLLKSLSLSVENF